MEAISVERVTKEYGKGIGCRDITLSVAKGTIFGLLGPNGAGKSTFVKMMVGLLKPTSGKAHLLGLPLGNLSARSRIGYLPELFRYQDWLTGEEVLRFHARLSGSRHAGSEQHIRQVLTDAGIGSRAGERVKHYSKGMQQRLGLACALLLEPELIFLDEPTSALDPIGRLEVRQILTRLRDQGKTVFLNTHLLEDVEVLCDEVALLNNGEIRARDTVENIRRQDLTWRFAVGGWTENMADKLEQNGVPAVRVIHMDENGNGVFEAVIENRERLGWVNHQLIQNGLTLYEVHPVEAHVEEWFLSLTCSQRGEDQ